jgi:hypothetical protein
VSASGLRRLLRSALALGLACAFAFAAIAPAAATPVIGVGEQHPGMFTDPHWRALDLRDVRLIVGWDVLEHRDTRLELDAYMTAARAARANLLVSFGRSRSGHRAKLLPSVARFASRFQAFRLRYPWVRQYVTWNEANHCSQPTCRRPERVAEYFDAMRRRCHGCTIVGPDVLDTPSMTAWAQRFRRATDARRLTWGLHNYIDANRRQMTGTRALLKATRGDVWFTETGGIVWRLNARDRIRLPGSVPSAARATRWVFKLASLSPRIKRIYFYNWAPGPTWDSGLVDAHGRPRPAYGIIRSYLGR